MGTLPPTWTDLSSLIRTRQQTTDGQLWSRRHPVSCLSGVPTTSNPLGNSVKCEDRLPWLEAGTAWGLIDGQPNFRRSARNVSPEESSRKGDLFWVWIPCKQLKKQCKAMYCGQASINLRTKPVISRDRIRRVYHKKSKHGHQTSYHTRWRSPISHSQSIAVQDGCLESGSPGAKSTRGTAWFMKKCSWDKLAREWGKPARGRERNQARLLR